MIQGGKRGTPINQNEPENSLLLQVITHEHEKLKMPPGKKMAEDEIDLLRTWIQKGAPWTTPKVNAGENESTTTFTQEDRDFWLFQPIKKPEIPVIQNQQWAKNPIDYFISHQLEMAGLEPAAKANKQTLIRRAYYDLTGLPPSPQEIEDFVQDQSPHAYEKLIDRLLESPAYGEKWARHWMDLARYAESDGYKADHYRPHAWRYRDYVIQSMNDDKPYNRFVMEQLAGDEIAPNDPDALIATGFLRLGIYEYNQRDARTQWDVILNDLTDVTGDLFLGMSVSCAKCHDHKFDPVLQKDYYRLRAFFAPVLLRNDIPVVSSDEWENHQAKMAVWEAMTEDIRNQIAEMEDPHYKRGAKNINITFPEDVQEMMYKPPQERTPFEHQIAMLAHFQTVDKGNADVNKIKGDEKKQLDQLYKQLKEYEQWKPEGLPQAMTIRDVGPFPPKTFIPDDPNQTNIEPGIFSILNAEPMAIKPVPSAPNSTGRRTALARWITHPENRITNRVIVNRIWQYHFGKGIVETASEFGRLGEEPTYPELLDWLAVTFVEEGWSLKKLHKLMMTSAAYQQSSTPKPNQNTRMKDPQNRLLSHYNARRLEAEEIRDSMLAVSDELQTYDGGISKSWSTPVRSIYIKVHRNKHDEILGVFDVPDGLSSTAKRDITTTPLQSLFLINSDWTLQRARALVERIESTQPESLEKWVNLAYQITMNRTPSKNEMDESVEFIIQQTHLIEQDMQDESQMIVESAWDFFWNELDGAERMRTVAMLQSAMRESIRQQKDKQDASLFVLAGGEGGPHYRLKEQNSNEPGIHSQYPVMPNAQAAALTDFCHILLNSSEFLYVQ